MWVIGALASSGCLPCQVHSVLNVIWSFISATPDTYGIKVTSFVHESDGLAALTTSFFQLQSPYYSREDLWYDYQQAVMSFE
jgi:hypothetical protein